MLAKIQTNALKVLVSNHQTPLIWIQLLPSLEMLKLQRQSMETPSNNAKTQMSNRNSYMKTELLFKPLRIPSLHSRMERLSMTQITSNQLQVSDYCNSRQTLKMTLEKSMLPNQLSFNPKTTLQSHQLITKYSNILASLKMISPRLLVIWRMTSINMELMLIKLTVTLLFAVQQALVLIQIHSLPLVTTLHLT